MSPIAGPALPDFDWESILLFPKRKKKIGFALSGGGAKGSFEVGALQYLYEIKEVNPNLTVGTSVGAINSIKISEGINRNNGYQGFPGLKKIWLDLKKEDDMFVRNKNTPDFDIEDIPSLIESSFLKLFVYGMAFPILGSIGAGIKAKNRLEKLKKLLDSDSLLELSPIGDKMSSGRFGGLNRSNPKMLDLDLLRASQIKCFVSVVGLKSGKLRYVDKFGQIYDRSNLQDPLPGPNVDVINAVLASAAIPVYFKPMELNGEIYVDGGVREIIPISSVFDLGMDTCYAIVAGADKIDKNDSSNPGSIFIKDEEFKPDLLSIIDKTLHAVVDEVGIGDVCLNKEEKTRYSNH